MEGFDEVATIMEEFDENTGEEDFEEQLVSKKTNSDSVIWRWFGFKSSDEQQKNVFCRQCRTHVPNSKGTANLFHHLQWHHEVEYEECVKLQAAATTVNTSQSPATKQSAARNSLSRVVPYERNSERRRAINKAVASLIVKDVLPVSAVEQDGFIQLLKVLDPRYQLPSWSDFSREVLPEMHAEVREGLAARLTKVSHFALTTVTWSGRTCERYMSVTIHFIEDWELKSACLQTSCFPQDHTKEHIASALQDVLTNWKLNPTGLVAITTDDGARTVEAAQLNEWLRMQCLGHSLHRAIGECSITIIV